MRISKLAGVVGVLGLLGGCYPEGDLQPSVVNSENSLTSVNGLAANGLAANGLAANGLTTSALVTHALATQSLATNSLVLAALRDTTAQGTASRMFFRYLVSCALPASASVTYTWNDSAGVTHTEVNPGGLNLAPSWGNGAVDVTGRQWVSACLAARTNSKGVNVPLSLRGNGAGPLQVSTQERADYPYGEGAFWGDLFGGSPWLSSCSRDAFSLGTSTSQYLSQGRTCATANGGCSIIKYVGPCYVKDNVGTGQACFTRDQSYNDWTDRCTSTMNVSSLPNVPVIATWLKP
jgi:hypothetical protein